jgi:hypothetical protein
VIHVRFTLLGYPIAGIDIDLPTPAEQVDAVDDAVDAQISEHWAAFKRWLR